MTTDTSTELATQSSAPVGLEDYDETVDAGKIPRLSIVHADAVFTDGSQTYDKVNAIVLALVKQRTLWSPDLDDDNKPPFCRSSNFREGRPGEEFPWKHDDLAASGITKASVAEAGGVIACNDCPLKEWGSHPSRDVPFCTEQFTFAILMEVSPDVFSPAIMSAQRSSIKAARQYVTGFQRAQSPMFTVSTTLTLRAEKKGSVPYAVLGFQKGEATDEGKWNEYTAAAIEMREYLQKPYIPEGDASPASKAGAMDATATEVKAPAKSADGDLPF